MGQICKKKYIFILLVGSIGLACPFLSAYSLPKTKILSAAKKGQAAKIFCSAIKGASKRHIVLFLNLLTQYHTHYSTQNVPAQVNVFKLILEENPSLFPVITELDLVLIDLLKLIATYNTIEEFGDSERALEQCTQCTAQAYSVLEPIKRSFSSSSSKESLARVCQREFEFYLEPDLIGIEDPQMEAGLVEYINKETQAILLEFPAVTATQQGVKALIREYVKEKVYNLMEQRITLSVETQLYQLISQEKIELSFTSSSFARIKNGAIEILTHLIKNRLKLHQPVYDVFQNLSQKARLTIVTFMRENI